MPTAKEVVAAVRSLLKSADLSKVTERNVRDQLAETLGDVTDYKKLIKEEVEDFLANLPEDNADDNLPKDDDGSDSEYAAGEDTAASDDSEEGQGTSSSKGKKRKATAASADDEPSLKIAKRSENGLYLSLEDNKFVVVETFRGRRLLSLRSYYEKNNELHPGKGITLSPEQWQTLQDNLDAILQALEDCAEDYTCSLSDLKKVTLAYTGGLLSADIREWYKTGNGEELAPGKKGIRLEKSQVAIIKEQLPSINSAFKPQGNKATASSSAAAQAGNTSAVPSGGKAPTDAEAGLGPGGYLELGGNKRAKVTEFKGRNYVDFREYYEKGGELLPGKKGIMLQVSEWQQLLGSLDQLQKAVEKKDLKFFIELGSKKRAALSEFKGKVYVGVREFYEKGGEMLPGAKGLNMTLEQWQVVVDNAQKINGAIPKE